MPAEFRSELSTTHTRVEPPREGGGPGSSGKPKPEGPLPPVPTGFPEESHYEAVPPRVLEKFQQAQGNPADAGYFSPESMRQQADNEAGYVTVSHSMRPDKGATADAEHIYSRTDDDLGPLYAEINENHTTTPPPLPKRNPGMRDPATEFGNAQNYAAKEFQSKDLNGLKAENAKVPTDESALKNYLEANKISSTELLARLEVLQAQMKDRKPWYTGLIDLFRSPENKYSTHMEALDSKIRALEDMALDEQPEEKWDIPLFDRPKPPKGTAF